MLDAPVQYAGAVRVLAVGPDDPDRTINVSGDGEPTRVLIAVTGPGLGFSAAP